MSVVSIYSRVNKILLRRAYRYRERKEILASAAFFDALAEINSIVPFDPKPRKPYPLGEIRDERLVSVVNL